LLTAEGEFIKRYRLDEPAFPHTSTANQFCSEAVGEAMAAPKADVLLEDWFAEIGKNMLERSPGQESPPAAEHG